MKAVPDKRHLCSAPFEAPIGPQRFDHHHLGKVVARKETDKGPIRIDDSKCHGLWSVKPIQHCHERSRAPHGLQGTHKTRNGRLPIVAF